MTAARFLWWQASRLQNLKQCSRGQCQSGSDLPPQKTPTSLSFFIPTRQISSDQTLQLFDVEIEDVDQARSQLIVDLDRIFLLEHARFRRNERTFDAKKFENAAQRLLVIIP